MPALSSKLSRRKYSTPRPKVVLDDVWKRTFEFMGLEPLSSKKDLTTMTSSINIHLQSPGPSLAQGSEMKKASILDLPSETQKEIFKYSNTTDLIILSLVSKHFRHIAAEHLYRSFHIVFPDEEEPPNNLPIIDGLAGGLNTFVTSDYDYAQHLREIIMEPLTEDLNGGRVYRQYRFDLSCGKFMSTLLLLTLRKAKALETFRWDIRVELSREVFKVLHGIRPLQNVHLRMQLGPSLYQPPPAIHASDTSEVSSPKGVPAGSSMSFNVVTKDSTKLNEKNVKSLLPALMQAPPTISGFKNLKTLAILDMDTLDYISEIKTCIGNSSMTLSSLKISFSEELAIKSRKPPPEIISDDDSDQEDEFGQGILPPGPPPTSGAGDLNGPLKALTALEEKKKQEEFLAKIFGMEKEEKEIILETKSSPIVSNEPDIISIDELRRKFLKTLAPVTLKLFATAKDNQNLGPDEAEVLEIIKKFEQVQEALDGKDDGQSPQQSGNVGSSTAKATPPASSAGMEEPAESFLLSPGCSEEPGLFDEPTPRKKAGNDDSDVSNPDNIDIEEPEGQELALDSDTPAVESSTNSCGGDLAAVEASTESLGANLPVVRASTNSILEPKAEADNAEDSSSLPMDNIALANHLQVLESQLSIHSTTREIFSDAQKLKKRAEKLKADLASGKGVTQSDFMELLAAEKDFTKNYNHRLGEVTRDLEDLGDQVDQLTKKGQNRTTESNSSTEMVDYIRSTRGLALTTLAIYLIPIKASILSRAVDLRVLRSVTLLNVGQQTPFWNLMARENKLAPLPLDKINTDNVTLPFLAFVSQLDNVTDLLLSERAAKGRVESTAAKSTVTMEQIRRVILKKHAATLQVLMLRNETGTEWDMNIKTAMLLCSRSKLLEELAVSFGSRTMHSFFQLMPGLVALRVFHTIQFRSDDHCSWFYREFRKFIVDNVSHNPRMKLEYIALDSSVDRLVRRIPLHKQRPDNKGKGKEASGNVNESSKKTFTQMVLGSGNVWPDGTLMSVGLTPDSMPLLEDSEDENGVEWATDISGKHGLKLETIEGIRFCDVTGVRIFKKDALDGRL